KRARGRARDPARPSGRARWRCLPDHAGFLAPHPGGTGRESHAHVARTRPPHRVVFVALGWPLRSGCGSVVLMVAFSGPSHDGFGRAEPTEGCVTHVPAIAPSRFSPPALVPGAAPGFEEVFEAEFTYVIHTLQRLGVPERDVDDVAHEVFLTV